MDNTTNDSMLIENNKKMRLQLQSRVEASKRDRTELQEKHSALSINIKKLIQFAPKKSYVSHEKLNVEIEKLEYKRTTNSLTLTAEKSLLRAIDGLNEKKRKIEEYAEYQIVIDNAKKEQDAISARKKLTEDKILELSKGIRMLDTAIKAGCEPKDLIKLEVEVPKVKMGEIIGKQGATMHQIESDCQVMMHVADCNSKVYLQGSSEGVEKAKAEIQGITEVEKYVVHIPKSTRDVLMRAKCQRLLEIQKIYHANIDLQRSSNSLIVRCKQDEFDKINLEIESIGKGYEVLQIDPKSIPAIIGKSGTAIESIMDSSGVFVEIDRERNQVQIWGTVESTMNAKTQIQTIVHENEEISKSIEVPLHYIAYLMEDKGIAAKNILNSLNVRLNIDREKNVLHATAKIAPLEEFCGRLEGSIQKFNAETRIVKLPQHIIPKIIGKGGATISKISADCGVRLNVDGKALEIQIRGPLKNIEAAEAAIGTIIDANQTEEFPLTDVAISAMLSQRGKFIDELASNAECEIHIKREQKKVLLTGTINNIKVTKQHISDFVAQNLEEKLKLDAVDAKALFTARKVDIKKIAEETQCKFDINRKNGVIYLRGTSSQIEAGRNRIISYTSGSHDGDNVVLYVDKFCIPAIIGKKGDTISKFQADFCVKLDLYHDHGLLRIRGEPGDVANCKAAIISFLKDSLITEVLNIANYEDDNLLDLSKAISKLEKLYGVQIKRFLDAKKILIQGRVVSTSAAKHHLIMYLKKSFECSVNLTPNQFTALARQGMDNVQNLREVTGISISLCEETLQINVKGIKHDDVNRAFDGLLQILHFFTPEQFALRTVPANFLPQLYRCRAEMRSSTLPLSISTKNSMVYVNYFIDQVSSVVRIFGTSPLVLQAAKDKLDEELNVYLKEHVDIEINPRLIRVVIGTKGKMIRHISQLSRTKIDVDHHSGLVSIKGPESGIVVAKNKIAEIEAKYESENHFMEIPSNSIASVIGNNGSRIKSIENEVGVKLNIMKDSSEVRITSSDNQAVERAKELIKNAINLNQVSTLNVDEHAIKKIIGKSGATIKALELEHDVNIDVNRYESRVIVRGSSANISKAKDAITQLVQVTKVVPISAEIVTEEERKGEITPKLVNLASSIGVTKKSDKNQRRRARRRISSQKASSDNQISHQNQELSATPPNLPDISSIDALLFSNPPSFSSATATKITYQPSYYVSTSGYALRL